MNFANKMQTIQKMMQSEKLFTPYSTAANMPFVSCSRDTFSDRAFAFESEELMKTFLKPFLDRKNLIKGIVYSKKDRISYFANLLSMNVDEVVYVESGNMHVFALTDIIRKQDTSKLPQAQRPLENPALKLSAVYFMQEVSRNVPPEEKTQLKDLEEEMAVNLFKGTYIMPAVLAGDQKPEDIMPQDGKKNVQFNIPLIKDSKGSTFQPIFTDSLEFARYRRDAKIGMMKIPFAGLEKMLSKDAKGFMLNPNGFHLVITREMISGLKVRFTDDTGKDAKPAKGEKTDENG